MKQTKVRQKANSNSFVCFFNDYERIAFSRCVTVSNEKWLYGCVWTMAALGIS